MVGKIFELDGKAKIEIWKDIWMLEIKVDAGGYCEICNKRFNKIVDLVKHFISSHRG